MEAVESACLIFLAAWSALDVLERAGHFEAGKSSGEMKLGFQLAVCVILGIVLSAALYFLFHYPSTVSIAGGTLFVSVIGVLAGFVVNKPFTTAPWLKSAASMLTFVAPFVLLLECIIAARHIGNS